MKNIILAEPSTLALGGLLVMMLVFFVIVAAMMALLAGLIVFFRRLDKKTPEPKPASTVVLPTARKCPQCGAELKPDAPEGLCPACLLRHGMATEGGVPPGTLPFIPPAFAELQKLFPQLEILELIGQGGMGAVYKARQPALDRLVALKILAPRGGSDLDFAGRFTREARALAKLSHPNIVAVYDFGRAKPPPGQDAQQPSPAAPLHYFIMEYVDGLNLRQLEQAGKLPSREALQIIPQICAALQFAHDEGIVHRDIKPENVLLDKKGRVKIADFGLAKILGEEAKDLRLTGARDVMGTPHYMAPEQVEHPLAVDHRADIYSLGVVFYEMLTGELPLGKFQPPSAKVQVDVRLDEVVLRSLEKEPERRYQHASEVKTRVETIAGTTGEAPAARRISAEEILARDYSLNIRSCLQRGWTLVRNNFTSLVATSVFVIAVLFMSASSEMTFWNGRPSGAISVLGAILYGPFIAGLYQYFLERIRRGTAPPETAFGGFLHLFPHLIIAGCLTALLTMLGFLCLVLPGIYLFVAWTFAFPLIIDKRLRFGPAMRLSRKIVSRHWWRFLGFLIVLGLINLAGILAFGIGLFISFPVTFAALAYAYEDIFSPLAGGAGNGSLQPARRRTAVRVLEMAAVAVALVFFLWLIALGIPNFIHARHHVSASTGQQVAAKPNNAGQAAFPRQNSTEITDTASQLAKEGWQLWQDRKPSEAEGKFQQAVQLAPGDANAWNGLGWAELNSGKMDEAEKAFRQAISLAPDQPGALTGLGQIYLSQKKYSQAETNFLKAAPQAPAAWYGLARLYLLEGKFDQAQKWAQDLIDAGQADDLVRQMLKAAQEKHLSDGLRFRIEPAPAANQTNDTKSIKVNPPAPSAVGNQNPRTPEALRNRNT